MTLTALSIFAAALFVNAASPGPSVAALVSRVLTNGIRDVLPFLVAMWIGEALWLTLAVTGLATLAQAFCAIFVALKYVGVAYLVFLAWKMWRAPVDIPDETFSQRRGSIRMFSAGFLVTLGNPKIALFYVALLPTFVDVAHLTVSGYVELVATLVVVLAGIDLTWSALAAQARGFLKSPRAIQLANRTGATMMAGAAAAIASR